MQSRSRRRNKGNNEIFIIMKNKISSNSLRSANRLFELANAIAAKMEQRGLIEKGKGLETLLSPPEQTVSHHDQLCKYILHQISVWDDMMSKNRDESRSKEERAVLNAKCEQIIDSLAFLHNRLGEDFSEEADLIVLLLERRTMLTKELIKQTYTI